MKADASGRIAAHPRSQDDQHADKPRPHRRPALPADRLAQHRAGQGDDEKRADREDGEAVDQPDLGVAPDDQADFRDQQHRADEMRRQAAGPDRCAEPLGPPQRQQDHEAREDPVADHDDHLGRIGRGQVLGKPVLRRKSGDSGHHQPDAKGRIARSGHDRGWLSSVTGRRKGRFRKAALRGVPYVSSTRLAGLLAPWLTICTSMSAAR
jgi:hypothetical protein